MKIVFLTGCMQSGEDGVGDYTRILASECQKLGHECSVIALKDRGLNEDETKEQDQDGVRVLRLSNALSSSPNSQSQLKNAKLWLNKIDPDWVSLQFVPYAYQPKGIVWGLEHRLRTLIESKRLHLMLHELWIGNHKSALVKHKLVGTIQKHFIRHMINGLRPAVIHTSNYVYQGLLQDIGFTSEILPLFGNIPLADPARAKEKATELNLVNKENNLYLGFFGTIQPNPFENDVAEFLKKLSQESGKSIVIFTIGKSPKNYASFERLKTKVSSLVEFIEIGPKPATEISEYFNILDYGLTNYPFSLIDKSGAAAAMAEHGLPVIVLRDDEKHSSLNSENSSESLFLNLKELSTAEILKRRRVAPKRRLATSTAKFLQSLTKSKA